MCIFSMNVVMLQRTQKDDSSSIRQYILETLIRLDLNFDVIVIDNLMYL